MLYRLKSHWLTPKRWMLYNAIALALLSFLLLFVSRRSNDRSIWKPVESPLKIEAGETAKASFIAKRDEVYEVAFEFRHIIPWEDLQTFVGVIDKPSPLDIKWSVFSGTEVIAEGTCRDYLYISSGGRSYKGRVLRIVQNHPFHRVVGGSIERGVGSFEGKSGNQYDVHAEVGTTIEKLNATQPRLVVRMNRRVWEPHYDRMRPVALSGMLLLGLSMFVLGWWVLTTLLKRWIKAEMV